MKNKNWIDKVIHNSLFWFSLLVGVLIFLFYNYQVNIFNYLAPKGVVGKIENLKFIGLFFAAVIAIGFFCIYQKNIFNYLDLNKILEKINKLKSIGYLFAALIALWQVNLANQGIRQIDKTIEISLNNSKDQRFKDAIELLGSEKAPTRLGAIYALHHLAIETFEKEKSYTKDVFEILCSYIRDKTNEVEYIKKYVDTKNEIGKPSIEIQTIVDLLFRIKTERIPYKLFKADLNNAQLAGVNLPNANLESANLESANLESAYLVYANLDSANLWDANLKSAKLVKANLKSAYLHKANLKSADLDSANLSNAILSKAILERLSLGKAILSNADFSNANLKKTIFKYAKIDGIILIGADIEGSDLKK